MFLVPLKNLTECREVMDNPEFSSMIHAVYEKRADTDCWEADQGSA